MYKRGAHVDPEPSHHRTSWLERRRASHHAGCAACTVTGPYRRGQCAGRAAVAPTKGIFRSWSAAALAERPRGRGELVCILRTSELLERGKYWCILPRLSAMRQKSPSIDQTQKSARHRKTGHP